MGTLENLNKKIAAAEKRKKEQAAIAEAKKRLAAVTGKSKAKPKAAK